MTYLGRIIQKRDHHRFKLRQPPKGTIFKLARQSVRLSSSLRYMGSHALVLECATTARLVSGKHFMNQSFLRTPHVFLPDLECRKA
jgi:hypothetical protein